MQSRKEPICWGDPTAITQAGDINPNCDISGCTGTFPQFTSFSKPQDVTVSAPIWTMPCLFKTCKQMLGNTHFCRFVLYFMSAKKKYSPSLNSVHMHTLPNMGM